MENLDLNNMTFEQFEAWMKNALAEFKFKVETQKDYEDFKPNSGGMVPLGDWIEWFGTSEGFM